jgi:glycine cleavage system H protein
MDLPKELKYTMEHEWAGQEGREVTIGITSHAQEELGDIVFLELPAVGTEVEKGKTFGVVESVKAVSDLYSPVSGKVVRVNEVLLDTPEAVNADPYGKGWMIVVELSGEGALEGLLSAANYEAYVREEKGK